MACCIDDAGLVQLPNLHPAICRPDGNENTVDIYTNMFNLHPACLV